MARFKLTPEGRQFVQGGDFQFKVGWGVDLGGSTLIRPSKACPVITMGQNDIVETINPKAIEYLSAMLVPQNSFRGGVVRDPGPIFQTTPSQGPAIDLDPIFASAS